MGREHFAGYTYGYIADIDSLGDRVAGCLAAPSRCAAIGRAAAEFFRMRGTPEAVWGYVGRRLFGMVQ
jgi:hypothetical protein